MLNFVITISSKLLIAEGRGKGVSERACVHRTDLPQEKHATRARKQKLSRKLVLIFLSHCHLKSLLLAVKLFQSSVEVGSEQTFFFFFILICIETTGFRIRSFQYISKVDSARLRSFRNKKLQQLQPFQISK